VYAKTRSENQIKKADRGFPLEPIFTILIADRNKHVRELLKRELSGLGHQVILAKTAAEIVTIFSTVKFIDLLILDSDLPDGDLADIMLKLKDRFDALPVIIHSCSCERPFSLSLSNKIFEIEKGTTSIEQIKILVDQISKKDAERFNAL
jgi:CheY-like chemotaxis protein